jgi:hypothetical protein
MTNVAKKSLLTFIEECQVRAKCGKKKGLYRCECGSIKEYFICNVKRLHTLSCGCRSRDTSSYKKHGLINHPIYWIWSGIVQRCTNPKNKLYPYYGGIGVEICELWRNDVKAFYDWCMANGWQPGLEVDKDTKGCKIYSPENCIIVTHKENSNRRRNNHLIEYKGENKTIAEWADIFKINSGDLCYRLKINNWNLGKALKFIPIKQKKKLKKE